METKQEKWYQKRSTIVWILGLLVSSGLMYQLTASHYRGQTIMKTEEAAIYERANEFRTIELERELALLKGSSDSTTSGTSSNIAVVHSQGCCEQMLDLEHTALRMLDEQRSAYKRLDAMEQKLMAATALHQKNLETLTARIPTEHEYRIYYVVGDSLVDQATMKAADIENNVIRDEGGFRWLHVPGTKIPVIPWPKK